MLLFGNGKAGRKLAEAALFLLVACLPPAAAMARNVMVADTATNRSLLLHPAGWPQVEALVAVLYAFLFPVEVGWAVQAVQLGFFVTLLVVGFILLYRRTGGTLRAAPFSVIYPALALLGAAAYIAFIFLSISLFDAGTPIDTRILLPVFVLAVPASAIVAQTLAQTVGISLVWQAFAAWAFLAVTFNLGATMQEVAEFRREGRGYTAPVWADSPTMTAVRDLPPSVEIYSEGWDAVRFLAGKQAISLPWRVHPTSAQPMANYQQRMDALCEHLAEGTAVLVFFDQVAQRPALPTEEELVAACAAPVLMGLGDGVIYGYADRLSAASEDRAP